jgi:hypothetical protein
MLVSESFHMSLVAFLLSGVKVYFRFISYFSCSQHGMNPFLPKPLFLLDMKSQYHSLSGAGWIIAAVLLIVSRLLQNMLSGTPLPPCHQPSQVHTDSSHLNSGLQFFTQPLLNTSKFLSPTLEILTFKGLYNDRIAIPCNHSFTLTHIITQKSWRCGSNSRAPALQV